MLRASLVLTIFTTVAAVNMKNEMARGMGAFEPMEEIAVNKDGQQIASADAVAQMVYEAEYQKEEGNAQDEIVMPTAGSKGLARSQSWNKPKEPEDRSSWMSTAFVIFLIVSAAAGALTMVSMKEEKGASSQEMTSMKSTVSLGVKPRAAPAPLPEGIEEVDVLETFDSLDKKRSGYIEADTLEGLLGPEEAAHESALKVVGNVDRLFYHDFRRLVLVKGPVRDTVLNTAARKRGGSLDELGELSKA